ncbi:MAG TPA: peptidylprolyl isomerase [Vicinamibacterales bacterium]|nr:peptidylprolyl isomerase [Vicinamibacterales bacterium]
MMMTIARLVGGFTLVLALAWPPQAGSGTLSGTVTSAGQPAPNVTVRAFGSNTDPVATVTTGADGVYTLKLPQGVYRIEFSGPSVDPSVRSGVVVLDGTADELNVTLAKAGTTPKPESLDDIKPGEVGVLFETRLGTIFIAADTVHAPITAANFLKYVDAGLYAGGSFHRATRPDNYTPLLPNRPPMELIQAGINPARAQEAFPPIPLERTSVTGLKHVAGTVSMARGTAADSATSDFFILLDDQPSLDFGGKRFDDGQGAAAFGRVYFGLGVARKIQQQPVEGQNLTPPIRIARATRLNRQ